MAATPEQFGSWHTAPDGTAHYVLAGKCLCGAKVKTNGPAPARSAKSLALVTPLCEECLILNEDRWRGKTGHSDDTPRPRRTYWWRRAKRARK